MYSNKINNFFINKSKPIHHHQYEHLSNVSKTDRKFWNDTTASFDPFCGSQTSTGAPHIRTSPLLTLVYHRGTWALISRGTSVRWRPPGQATGAQHPPYAPFVSTPLSSFWPCSITSDRCQLGHQPRMS